MTFKNNWEKTDQHFNITPQIIHDMVAQYSPKTLTHYEIISGGCANLNIKIHLDNMVYILRIYIRDQEAAYCEQKLNLILKSTIPIPEIYFIGDYEGYRFTIIEYIPGITLREFLLKEKRYEIMYDVGLCLAKIQSVNFSPSDFFDHNLDIERFVNECLKNPMVIDALQCTTLSKIKFYFKKYKNFLPHNQQKNLVHGDFDPSNILVDQINGVWKITGILDWEFSFLGSTLVDISNMLRYAHQVSSNYKNYFLQGLKEGGLILPNHWKISIHLLNLLSLLDCLARSDDKQRPNQLEDILMLIHFILRELDSMSITLLTDPKVLAIPIKECNEPLINLKDQDTIIFGPSPEIPNNTDYTKIRKSVYDKLIKAQKMLPQGLKFCLYEGYRSLNLQEKLFNNRYQKLKNAHSSWFHEEIFIETTKLVSPVTNLDGSQNIPPHSTGAAIDIYLINSKNEIVDMGIRVEDWAVDLDGSLSKTNSSKISKEALENRKIMNDVLTTVGFINYPTEYWHWSYGDRYWAYHKKKKYAFYGSV